MNTAQQIIHILRKDLRHLKAEIAVSISLVAVFAWIAPASWPGYLTKMAYPGAEFGAPQFINGILHLLIPVSWLILISRAVHDESLVGEKQFWVTRPYTWYSLLASKLLFVLSVICLPMFLAQCFLIHFAGLPFFASLPALLANLAAIFLLFLLPFLVLAAVTSSFGPLLLLVLGGVLYLGVAGLVATLISGMRAMPPYGTGTGATLLALLFAGVLLHQYMKRKTGLSQIILLASPWLVSLVVLSLPANALFNHVYPVTTARTMKVDLDPTKQQPGTGDPLIVRGHVVLNLPLIADEGPEAGMLAGRSVRMDMISASGFHWTSPWQISASDRTVNVLIPESVAQRVGNDLVTIKIAMAEDRSELKPATDLHLTESYQAIPGGGVCSLVGTGGFDTPVCRYTLHAPTTFVDTAVLGDLNPLACGTPSTPSIPARATIIHQSSSFSFDPVVAQTIRPQMGGETPQRPIQYVICPGAPLRVTPTQPGKSEQILVEQTGLELPPYLMHLSQRKPMQ